MGKKLTKLKAVNSQPNKLTNQTSAKRQPNKLTSDENLTRVFKISICEQLDNRYCFKDLNREALKSLHAFIDETVGKKLTISQTEDLFLRTKGQVVQNINGRDLIHFGKNRNPFRIFGYYNSDGYFNIIRIDPKHNTNKD